MWGHWGGMRDRWGGLWGHLEDVGSLGMWGHRGIWDGGGMWGQGGTWGHWRGAGVIMGCGVPGGCGVVGGYGVPGGCGVSSLWGRCGMWVVGSPEVLRSWGDVRSLGVMGLLRGLRGHWRGHGVHRGSWGHRGGVGRRGVMGSWGDVGSLGRLGGQWGMWDHGGVRDRWSYGVSTESGVPGVTGCWVRGVCGVFAGRLWAAVRFGVRSSARFRCRGGRGWDRPD